MSPPTAAAARRQTAGRSAVAKRRAVVRRRRRSAVAIVLVGVVVAAVVLGLPFARKAVNELGLPLHYQDVIRQQAADKHLDAALIAGVIYAETKFDARTSSAGAVGLMQILPATARFLAHRSGATTFSTADLSTPQVNIAYGSYYLRYLLDEYHGSTVLALAAYNGGEANVNRWIGAKGGRPEDFKIEDIPFPETRAYVDRVLSARRDYRQTYARQLGYG
ncbi:MAG TPA: lytic transglycosylase domain-containing protein [Solirubrobacteraceae bacterium]